MLRLSKLTDYGIVIMTYLAKEPAAVRAANDVSAGTRVAPPTVSKILKLLHRGGLVVSCRGPLGGYRLAREPQQISVAEVVDALEGPVAVTECTSASGNCVQASHCSVRANWERINQAIRQALEGVTLQQMLAPATSSAAPDVTGLRGPGRARSEVGRVS